MHTERTADPRNVDRELNDPDMTTGKNDIISTEGMDGTPDKGDGDDLFSDEGLDQPGGTSGAESGTAGLARDDE